MSSYKVTTEFRIMFTGIIQAVGQISHLQKKSSDCRIKISTSQWDLSSAKLGDSIAVNGVCLTVIEMDESSFSADVSNETLSLTTLGKLTPGSNVNLEKALTLSTPLGGHLVSGHIDGVGTVVKRSSDGRSERFEIEAPAALAKYIAHKGSICVDGISLTVNSVNGAKFDLNIVPHTLKETILDAYGVGHEVNLEVDLIARYLERLILGDKASIPSSGNMTEAFLAEHGFVR